MLYSAVQLLAINYSEWKGTTLMFDIASMLGGGEQGGGMDPRIGDLLERLVKMEENRGPIDVANVVRHEGLGIVLPPGMPIEQAVRILRRKLEEDERKTTMLATINAQPFDGAIAFHAALKERFGYVLHTPASFFGGGTASKTIEVDAYGGTVDVPLGEYEVGGIDGSFIAGFTRENGKVLFEIRANIQGKHRSLFDEIVARTKVIVATSSLYRGKTMKVQFVDEDGDPLDIPIITFVDVRNAPRPIFSREVEEIFDNDILAYVQHPDIIRELEGSLKRGILLAARYGLGKTMAASHFASQANQNGFTVIYTTAAEALQALELARQYQPAVVFAEDIDTAANSRDEEANELLNELSGIGNPPDVIAVFTTNFPERIDEAFLRPGRMDVVLTLTPPDAEASVRIARAYAGEFMDAQMDYSEAGESMAGEIPASIQEIVRRAKVRARVGGYNILLPAHLIAASQSMKREREVLKPEKPADEVDRFGHSIGKGIADSLGPLLSGEHALVRSQNGHHPEPATKTSRTL